MSNFLEIQPGISLHYQTFGNPSAIPVLFVHGGPGACCEDYQNINQKFFNTANYYVIEVDQRGTGKSQPSVRDNHTNMQHYLDITITQMSSDFELLRKHLNITKWLVFGGSWGSTLGLDYACTYPSVCLGLILRGIFLNTKAEHDAIYARKSFTNDVRRLKEFDIFHELALKEDDKLEPNDSQRFIEIYESLIIAGNRDAIWRFYVYENNLMEEDENEMLDPFTVPPIDDPKYREAMSISFFEARLFLQGTFEQPIDLLSNVSALKNVPVWVCQGTGDEVCPEKFAQDLCTQLDDDGIVHIDHFVDSGHKASSNGMTDALVLSVQEWYEKYGDVLLKEFMSKGEGEEKTVMEDEDDMFGNLDELRMDAGMDGVGMPPDQ